MSFWGNYSFAPRKSVAQRRAEAERAIRNAAKRGNPMTPVTIEGRTIAHTFWGKAWCDNLERYQDFAYRLERGRSYVRSGSVIDLKIETGIVRATVLGSSLYNITIEIDEIETKAWRALKRACAGHIASRLDLLAGRLTEPVMARLCADRTGMFPAPSAIGFSCSCPDYALVCKHVAAVMYGVGTRLDHAPELLFMLRGASADELHAAALSDVRAAPSKSRLLRDDSIASLFGIELAETPKAKTAVRVTAKPRKRRKTRREKQRAKSRRS